MEGEFSGKWQGGEIHSILHIAHIQINFLNILEWIRIGPMREWTHHLKIMEHLLYLLCHLALCLWILVLSLFIRRKIFYKKKDFCKQSCLHFFLPCLFEIPLLFTCVGDVVEHCFQTDYGAKQLVSFLYVKKLSFSLLSFSLDSCSKDLSNNMMVE